jgi:hypothetical protein
MHLNNQYLLTFDGGNGGGKRKGRFDRFHVGDRASERKVPHAVGSVSPREEELKEQV